MKDSLNYIKHIQEAIEQIESYLGDCDFKAFSGSPMLFDATIRELEIIGEAANRITEEFQKKHSGVPWRKVIGMRNKLIHEYFEVNKKVVWLTCKEDLPELKKIVLQIISESE